MTAVPCMESFLFLKGHGTYPGIWRPSRLIMEMNSAYTMDGLASSRSTASSASFWVMGAR